MHQKILIINTLYAPHIGGGAEIICQEQAEGLARKGFDVTVLTTGCQNVVECINGVRVVRRKIKNIYWHYFKGHKNSLLRFCWHLIDSFNLLSFFDLKRQIKRIGPDIVFLHNATGFSASVIKAVKANNIPLVQILHDQYYRCANSNAFRANSPCLGQCARCRLLRLPHRRLTNKVDVVVGVSKFVLDSLTNLGYFKDSKKQVIYNARVFPEVLRPLPWNTSEPLKIGFIGTLTYNKGIEWLIDSFLQLDINAELYIAGGGENQYVEYLKNKCNNDNRIVFEGYVNSIEHYKKVHLSVVPSLWPDTFPTVAFESCVHGRPVIATNVGGLPEIIKHNVNGILVDAVQPKSLFSAIKSIYDNAALLENLARCANSSVKQCIDMEAWILKYENIINSNLNNK